MDLTEARKEARLSQEEVAGRLGISRQTYAKMEKDPGSITVDDAKKLAEMFRVSISDIFSLLTMIKPIILLASRRKEGEMATRLYTPSEYASLMRVTPQYVRRCCADGTVKAFRMSIGQGKRRTWRIPFDEESIGNMAAQNAAACASAAAGAEV